ncbi:hypothetical protein [Serratia marcescens]|uniref:hypothetical protein n=1 Tax=Serratia marcescens TaxID=615 RepID=UPI001F155B61|nr:hypothetical protein [Serratia marcescens]
MQHHVKSQKVQHFIFGGEMVSKRRVMVNFSDSELHKFVLSEANKTNSSSSRVIENLVYEGLGKRIDNGELYLSPVDKIKKNKNLVPTGIYETGLTVSLHHGDNASIISHAAMHEIRGFVKSVPPFSLTPEFKSVYNIEGFKSEIINDIHLLIRNRLTNGSKPDIVLVFVSDVKFSCKGDSINGNGFIDLEMKYSCKFIPVYLRKRINDNILRLDFLNARYMTFRDVATKGWDRSNYSHLLHIKGLSKSKIGGYFVGLLYSPQDPSTLIINKDLLMNPVGIPCKIFMSSSAISLKRNTFPVRSAISDDDSIFNVYK